VTGGWRWVIQLRNIVYLTQQTRIDDITQQSNHVTLPLRTCSLPPFRPKKSWTRGPTWHSYHRILLRKEKRESTRVIQSLQTIHTTQPTTPRSNHIKIIRKMVASAVLGFPRIGESFPSLPWSSSSEQRATSSTRTGFSGGTGRYSLGCRRRGWKRDMYESPHACTSCTD
jgi:hypothetical protein